MEGRCEALGTGAPGRMGTVSHGPPELSLSFADDLYRKPAFGEGHVVLQTLSSQSSSGSSQQLGSEAATGNHLGHSRQPGGRNPQPVQTAKGQRPSQHACVEAVW